MVMVNRRGFLAACAAACIPVSLPAVATRPAIVKRAALDQAEVEDLIDSTLAMFGHGRVFAEYGDRQALVA